MSDLTPEQLAELRLLLDEAPPLPYRDSPCTHGLPSDGPTYVALEAQHEGRWEEVATGEYERWAGTGIALAAAAVNALPALLAAATELAHMREARDNARAEAERLTAQVERVRELADYIEVETDTVEFLDADTGVWWGMSDAIRAALDGELALGATNSPNPTPSTPQPPAEPHNTEGA